MSDEQGYDPTLPLGDVIRSLLRFTLPEAFQSLADLLAEDALRSNPCIAPYAAARWSDLSESEGNIVAREVGLIAHNVSHRLVSGGTELH